MNRYFVPAGTRVAVARVARRRMDWRAHTTRQEMRFDRVLKTDGDCVVFQFGSWYVYVERKRIRHVTNLRNV